MTDTTTADRTGLAPLSAEERDELRTIAESAQQGRWWWGGDIGSRHCDVELHAIVPGNGYGVVNVLRQQAVERTPEMADTMIDQAREYIEDEGELNDIREEWLTDSYGERRTDNRLAFADPEKHIVTPARDLAVFEVARNQGLPDDTPADHPKVYRHDVVDVRNANARHIVAARPEMVLRLLADLDRAEQAAAAAVEAPHPTETAAGYVVIEVPSVAHKGELDTDAGALLQVAQNLDRNLYAGGSNVRAAVSRLLRNVAAALTDDPRTTSELRRAGRPVTLVAKSGDIA